MDEKLTLVRQFGEVNGIEPIETLYAQVTNSPEEIYIDLGKMQKELSVDAASIYKAAEYMVQIGLCYMVQHHKCGFNFGTR